MAKSESKPKKNRVSKPKSFFRTRIPWAFENTASISSAGKRRSSENYIRAQKGQKMKKERKQHQAHPTQPNNSNSNSKKKSKSKSKPKSDSSDVVDEHKDGDSDGKRKFIPFKYFKYVRYASQEKEDELTRLVQGYHEILLSMENTNKSVAKAIRKILAARQQKGYEYRDEGDVHAEFASYLTIMDEAFEEIDRRIANNSNSDSNNNSNDKNDNISYLKVDFTDLTGSAKARSWEANISDYEAHNHVKSRKECDLEMYFASDISKGAVIEWKREAVMWGIYKYSTSKNLVTRLVKRFFNHLDSDGGFNSGPTVKCCFSFCARMTFLLFVAVIFCAGYFF